MIGIRAIATYIPESVKDNYAQAEIFSESRAFIEEKIGAIMLPVEEGEASDLAAQAVQALVREQNLDLNSIQCLVVVTQNPDGNGIPHASAVAQAKLGMPKKVACFDVSLGCSGYVYGLQILRGFLESSSLQRGILVTADPYSKIINSADKNTSLLFGDAATATLMDVDSNWKIEHTDFQSDGSKAENLHNKSGYLEMNGRQVFNFALTEVPKQIFSLLNKANLPPEAIDYYVLHQGSKFIVETIAKKFGQNKEKFLCDITHTGNTVSSSIPLLLKECLTNPEIRKILISGFGVGLSWGAMILGRR